MLKAHVVKETREHPPKIHNLLRLLQLADLFVDDEYMNTLKRLNAYQIEGRYPELATAYELSERHAASLIAEAEKALEWLKSQL